jgi:hypothetical protein
MSRPAVGVGLAVLAAAAVLALLWLGGWLVGIGERKLAAAASALSVAAAVTLLLLVTLLAGQLARWVRDGWARRRGPAPAGDPPASGPSPARDAGRRP